MRNFLTIGLISRLTTTMTNSRRILTVSYEARTTHDSLHDTRKMLAHRQKARSAQSVYGILSPISPPMHPPNSKVQPVDTAFHDNLTEQERWKIQQCLDPANNRESLTYQVPPSLINATTITSAHTQQIHPPRPSRGHNLQGNVTRQFPIGRERYRSRLSGQ